MRHTSTTILAAMMAVVIGISSCGGSEGPADPVTPEPSPSGDKVSLDAGIDDYQTRTALEISGTSGKTLWEIGDLIEVYDGSGRGESFGYAFPKGSDPSVGRFFAEDESTTFDVAAAKMAYYPGDRAVSCSGGTVTASVPSTQTYVSSTEGSFGPGAAPMVSNVFGDKFFRFRNVFGGVIIPLYDTRASKVTSIRITSSSTYLCGDDFKFYVSGTNEISVTPPATNPGKVLTMAPDVTLGTTAETAVRFCFMLPGLGNDEKVTVEITTGTYVFTKTFTVNRGEGHSVNVLTANSLLRLSALEVGTQIDFGVDVAGWDRGGSVETIKME